jgi:hypothetical protein
MNEKSFRQILEESMTSIKGPEVSSPPNIDSAFGGHKSEGPRFEIPFWPEFQLHTKPAFNKGVSNVYPTIRRAKVVPPLGKTVAEQWLETKALGASELAAIRTLELEITEGKLAFRTLKRIYRQEILRLHPDHHPKNISSVETEKLLAAFREVRAAYQVLQAAFRKVSKSGEALPKS